ncbi:MAG: hypothetical protein QXF41_01335 [Candidatus Micrarchaeaceae archaeon]
MGKIRLQAAVDFMMSYGIAILIITIAIGIIYKVGVLNPSLTPVSCTPAPGFSCGLFSMNRSGALSIELAQASGAPIIINGVACSSGINQTSMLPAYGNIYVTSNSAFYPANSYPIALGTLQMYSGTSYTFKAYCYGAGGIATGSYGNVFLGYVWINYTVQGYGRITQQVATITVKYT